MPSSTRNKKSPDLGSLTRSVNGEDYRCYATGELVFITTCPRTAKFKKRLHKKLCPTCQKWDDNKTHRYLVAKVGESTMDKKMYVDNEYSNGTGFMEGLGPMTQSQVGSFGFCSNTVDYSTAEHATLDDAKIIELQKEAKVCKGRGR